MISFLAAAILSGSCQQVACQVASQVAVAPLAYYPVDAYWYVAGKESQVEQRLQKLEQILEQQVQINQRLTQGVSAPQSSQVESSARNILNSKCMRCHEGEAKNGGGFKLDKELSVGEKLLIADKVESGEMPPPPAKELDDEDFQVLRAWANENKAAVRAFLKGK